MPNILPSIIFSQRIQEKASLAGFDWDDIEDVWIKMDIVRFRRQSVYTNSMWKRNRALL